jgi:predicted esterase
MNYIFTFPSARVRPYSLGGGGRCAVWHDRTALDIACDEDTEGVCDAVHNVVDKCIESLVSKGAPVNRIFIFGMSMGGHVALQTILYSKYIDDVAGVIGLSCFLSRSSPFWTGVAVRRAEGRPLPPVLMMHGTSDDMVPCDWGVATSTRLKEELGMEVVFEAMPGMHHDMCMTEMVIALTWIRNRLQQLADS